MPGSSVLHLFLRYLLDASNLISSRKLNFVFLVFPFTAFKVSIDGGFDPDLNILLALICVLKLFLSILQHGTAECLLNTVEACAIDTWPQLVITNRSPNMLLTVNSIFTTFSCLVTHVLKDLYVYQFYMIIGFHCVLSKLNLSNELSNYSSPKNSSAASKLDLF